MTINSLGDALRNDPEECWVLWDTAVLPYFWENSEQPTSTRNPKSGFRFPLDFPEIELRIPVYGLPNTGTRVHNSFCDDA